MRPLALLSLTATLTLPAVTPPVIKPNTPPEISRLDDYIQMRFLDRTTFGINRMGGPMPTTPLEPGVPFRMKVSPRNEAFLSHMRMFRPENPTEQSVVDQLRQKGFEVAAYLIGHQALAETPVPTPRAGLQGPVSITSRSDTQFADETFLFSEGKKALASIGQGPGYDVKKGDWNMAIRPLRASNQTCIQCHTTVDGTPKLGDALGVVMYVYRQHD